MREILPQIPQLGGINPSLSAVEKFPPPPPSTNGYFGSLPKLH